MLGKCLALFTCIANAIWRNILLDNFVWGTKVVTTFLYDSFGSITNETVIGVAGTNTIERFYDDFGRSLGYSLNGVRQSTLAYDPATGRLSSMQVPDSNTQTTQTLKNFTWSYLDGSDLKSSLDYPNGLTASWTYDANNQLLQVCNATPTNVISQYAYTYDAAGRRVQITRSGSAMSETRTDTYGYNARSELISAAKSGGSASVSAVTECAYQYDDIGNRLTSLDLGTNRTYTANNLNQYTSITDVAAAPSPSQNETFTPQFDDDGNQTLIQTSTGIWQVQYNGENRPVLWENVATNSPTPDSSTPTLITMSYDRMGRRVTKNDLRFVYDGYLQIANFEIASTNSQLTTQNSQLFIWDPTEPVATRPLMWNRGASAAYYTHDGNKNVSEVVATDGVVSAHYEYAPFGSVLVMHGEEAQSNPWRFSSEYAEDDSATVYYNYRHYEPVTGRWLRRDLLETDHSILEFQFCHNSPSGTYDYLGRDWFAPPGPPPGGWNAPPQVVSPPQILPARQDERSQLQRDRDTLEAKLVATCPQGYGPIETPWGASCCRESCLKQAKAIADAVLKSVQEMRVEGEPGGWVGNAMSWKDKGNGCNDWSLVLNSVVEKALVESLVLVRNRCFEREIDRELKWILIVPLIHKFVNITGSDGTQIILDPWPSGGRSLFP